MPRSSLAGCQLHVRCVIFVPKTKCILEVNLVRQALQRNEGTHRFLKVSASNLSHNISCAVLTSQKYASFYLITAGYLEELIES